uniref:TPR_REGION domain-containing protein n=1 Tax=Heterorhabditis bacteriophora TaxID=37862 RepID=A0A1I7X367_HETBA
MFRLLRFTLFYQVNSHVESTSELDPRIQTAKAHAAFMKGDAVETLRITSYILEKHGLYMDCIMVHINSLVQLGDAERLFLLGHRLVDAFADEDISWYAVALYYYVCKNAQAAKNFMNKATMMNTGFGEGWLAFGHIMAAEAENEQALNCYYRASRILERHFEPLLYVAIQYCKSGVRLAEQFLNDAAALAPTNPIVVHEQGCLAYNNKDYLSAQRFFEKALRYATNCDEENISMQTLARLYDIHYCYFIYLISNILKTLFFFKVLLIS